MKLSLKHKLALSGIFLYLLYKYQPSLATAKNGKSLLWELSGKPLKQPSYLLGTMHLMCAEDARLTRNVINVLKRVDLLVLEVDMNTTGELIGGIIDFNMKDSGILSDHLSQDEYDLVKSFFETHQPHLPFSILERQHPLMLSSGLYELFLPCEIKNGIEVKLVEEAHRLSKKTAGLETLEFQADIFNSIPYGQQAKDLVKTIENIDRFKEQMDEMLAVYKSQDLDQLYQLTLQDETGVNAHMDVLLYQRNKTWIDSIEEVTKKQAALFAVGAGHLGGDEGVLQLLRNRGYHLRPIANE